MLQRCRPGQTGLTKGPLGRTAILVCLAQMVLCGCRNAEAPSGHLPFPPTPSTVWSRPVLASYGAAGVYMVWADHARSSSGRLLEKGDALFASTKNEKGWLSPRRLFERDSPAWFFAHPTIARTSDRMFLCWTGWTGLYFSAVPIAEAENPKAWALPVAIASIVGVDRQAMLAENDGNIHILFGCLGKNLGGDGGFYYLRSEDGGHAWSAPVRLARIDQPETSLASMPQMTIDAGGGLHAVWSEYSAPRWTGTKIVYARSNDHGKSWAQPKILFDIGTQERWADAPNIVSTQDGSIHLVWTCGWTPHRCYSCSSDGGQSWTARKQIFGDFVSLAGWDTMQADSAGALFFVTQLRFPMGMYFAVRRPGSDWTGPVAFESRLGFEDGHYPSAVFSANGDFHAIWQRRSDAEGLGYLRLAPDGRVLELSFSPLQTADGARK